MFFLTVGMVFSWALLIDCITMSTFELFWGLEMFFGEGRKATVGNLLYFILTRALLKGS